MESHLQEGGGNSTTTAEASTSTECATDPTAASLQSMVLSTMAHAQSPNSNNSANRSTAVSPDNTSVPASTTAASAGLGSAAFSNDTRASDEVTVVEVIDLSSDTEENNDDGDQSVSKQQPPNIDGSSSNSSSRSPCCKLKRKRRLMEQRKQNEQKAMLQSLQGRAFLLVERLIQVRKNTLLEVLAASNNNNTQPKQHCSPTLVGHDDMVWLAERFLACQQDFKAFGKPTQVTLAYHYTSVRNLQSIRQGGLLSHPEQHQHTTSAVTPNTSKIPVAFFGQGIYVANNPYIFAPYYGDTCLLVAVLKGHQVRVEKGGATDDPGMDTALGNKTTPNHPLAEEAILQQASQCLPILRFPRTFLYPNNRTLDPNADALIRTFYEKIQRVLDEFLNESTPTVIRPHLPTRSLMTLNRTVAAPTAAPATRTTVNGQMPGVAALPNCSKTTLTHQQFVAQILAARRALQANATSNGPAVTTVSVLNSANPSRLAALAQQQRTAAAAATNRAIAMAKPLERLPYTAPPQLATVETCSRRVRTLNRADNCSICSQSLMLTKDKGRVVQLDQAGCFHMFHEHCLGAFLQQDICCPTCHLPVTTQGTSPSGVLTIAHTTALCGGYTQIDSNASSDKNGGPASTTSCNGSIVLVFAFPSGIQHAYHQTPGLPYEGTKRVAYLPNSAEGRALLPRMKHAWAQGLFFAVGTSQATGKSGVIVWGSSVEFKSQLLGRYGFPDVDYIARVNAALDALQVPP